MRYNVVLGLAQKTADSTYIICALKHGHRHTSKGKNMFNLNSKKNKRIMAAVIVAVLVVAMVVPLILAYT